MNRRSFLIGLLSTTAAPAIAKAMPEKLVYDKATRSIIRTGLPTPTWRLMYQGVPIREVDSLARWGASVESIITKTLIKGGTCE